PRRPRRTRRPEPIDTTCCCASPFSCRGDSSLTSLSQGSRISDRIMSRFAALVLAAAATAAVAHGQSRDVSELDALLDKVTDYVAGYTHDFIGVVAEETYRQEVRSRSNRVDSRGFPTEGTRQSRTLRSDMLLVRAAANDRWLQF